MQEIQTYNPTAQGGITSGFAVGQTRFEPYNCFKVDNDDCCLLIDGLQSTFAIFFLPKKQSTFNIQHSIRQQKHARLSSQPRGSRVQEEKNNNGGAVEQ